MADLVWSDPDPDKEEFAISPRFVPLPPFSHLERTHGNPAAEPGTLLVLKWSRNFSKLILWCTFFALINSAWKVSQFSTMIDYQPSGRHQIIVIVVVIWRVFLK